MRHVCREWSLVTRSQYFIHHHLRNSTGGVIIQERLSPRNGIYVEMRRGCLEICKFYCGFYGLIRSSCNGLVVISDWSKLANLYVANPLTKQWTILPPFFTLTGDYSDCGIAFVEASLEYKVVCAFGYKYVVPKTQIAILTIGLDKVWRHIDIKHLLLPTEHAWFGCRVKIVALSYLKVKPQVWIKTLFNGLAISSSPWNTVVIVDDGSADGTRRVAFDYVKRYTIDNISVVFLGRNHGKCEAIRKGVLHSRGELILMLDADEATKVSDLEKLENQILTLAMEERKFGGSRASDSAMRISDVPIAAFGSRAHLEEKALATVDSFGCRKWYRNFLMKGFHLGVLLATGSGIRDIQCGFKMFVRAAAWKLFMNVRLKR
ncbi:uncharacterized protein [Primulina huaijiensis]|uniref:uncharacterized protein n=1 Tax=Primulina huaijiensis TaxID=1492673 RepID=UPI003CC7737D